MNTKIILTLIGMISMQTHAGSIGSFVAKSSRAKAGKSSILEKRAFTDSSARPPGTQEVVARKPSFPSSQLSVRAFVKNQGAKGEIEFQDIIFDNSKVPQGLKKTSYNMSETSETPTSIELSAENGLQVNVRRNFGNNFLSEQYVKPIDGIRNLRSFTYHGSREAGRSPRFQVFKEGDGDNELKIVFDGNPRLNFGHLKIKPSEGKFIDFKVSSTGDRVTVYILKSNKEVEEKTYSVVSSEYHQGDLKLTLVGTRKLDKKEIKKYAVKEEVLPFGLKVADKSPAKGMDVNFVGTN